MNWKIEVSDAVTIDCLDSLGKWLAENFSNEDLISLMCSIDVYSSSFDFIEDAYQKIGDMLYGK